MKGLALLNDINSIRACQGKSPIARISLPGTLPDDPERCPVASVTGATVAVGTDSRWLRRFVLRFDSIAVARAVAAEIAQPHASDRPEVLAPDAVVSLVCAVHYGLVFEDPDGFLRGWIEPTDGDPSVWDLQLMPGQPYPDGHTPRIADEPADPQAVTRSGQEQQTPVLSATSSVTHASGRTSAGSVTVSVPSRNWGRPAPCI
jgi:hypothetical protein